MDRIEFEKVYMVYNSLFEAYHTQEQAEDENFEVSEMFMSLWTIFLNSVSWSEEEFWQEMDNQSEGECPCGTSHEDEEKLNELDTTPLTNYKNKDGNTLN